MTSTVYDQVEVIDSDTHVVEPADLWTSRISVKQWGDQVPHVRTNEATGEDFWYFGEEPVSGAPGLLASAFWPEYPPNHPLRMSDAHPSTWDVSARVAKMDELGIHAQVLYPNAGGFGSGQFSVIKDPELNLLCVKAYNDFLVDYSNSAPGRFVPVMSLPFWDVELSVKEIERSRATGHKGINITADPESWGMPPFTTKHWDPIWATCQDLELSVSFHIAGGKRAGNATDFFADRNAAFAGDKTSDTTILPPDVFLAGGGLSNLLGNATSMAKLIIGGVCHRFPRVNFVSVESGVGWIVFALESLDYLWQYCGVAKEHPEYGLLPSEYFKRQFYATFWYERTGVRQAIEALGPDNVMYSTDFPHPTSMSKGLSEVAQTPRDYVTTAFADVPASALRKVLHDNAAKVFDLS